MLRITPNNSAKGASTYYDEGLSKQDYYTEKNEIIGNWGGIAADKLGLSGEVTKDDFVSLCYNQNPQDQKQLTARNIDNRTVGYDFTFSVPKSVSIAYSVGQDNEILEAFRNSVSETMQQIEKEAATRVRKNGLDEDRQTGNLIWGEFIHTTSRPVDGVPDCHLHAHCFTFNATYDEHENQWKAAQFRQLKTDAPYYEAYFNSALADKLQKIGYRIERNERDFEIAGIERATIEKFSRRTEEIEKLAAEKEITNSKALDGLGAKTRASKRKGLTPDELRENWKTRLTKAETEKIFSAFGGKAVAIEKKKEISEDHAIDYALQHSLERKSAIDEKRLLTEALKRGCGSFNPDELKKQYQLRQDIIVGKKDNVVFTTTKDAINEERKLVATCHELKGRFKALNTDYQPKNNSLNHEQRQAVHLALNSTDGIMLIEGGAGTGKTTLMNEVKAGIEEGGKTIFPFAPSSDASRGVLRSEGYESADTISSLIANKKQHEHLKNGVIWIDEAGMVGNHTMNQVLEIAQKQNARIILTGDTKQHSSVERGDAMRIIKEKGGVRSVRVNEVVRQKNAAGYKAAMELLSKGQVEKGYSKLDQMGAVQEITDTEQRHKQIAADYLAGINERKGKGFKEVLVVAPTHYENENVTSAIRDKLKEAGKIDSNDLEHIRHKNLSLTNAQKQDAVNFHEGHVVEFHQNVKGFKAGSRYEVKGRNQDGKIIVNSIGDKEQSKILPLAEAENFQVFEKRKIVFATGDKIRITQNGKATNGRKLNNGQIYDIVGFMNNGNIRLNNGTTLPEDFAHFTHGYAVTSNAAQGKTVDKVIVAQSSASFPATTKEQFYVSASRGRESVTIYTDNKQELQERVINRSAERITATEIADIAKAQSVADKLKAQQTNITRLQALKESYAEGLRATADTFTKMASRGYQRILENARKYSSIANNDNTEQNQFTRRVKTIIANGKSKGISA